MTGSDDKILELLADSGVALNKKAMEVNVELSDETISYSTLKRRLPKLEDAELVELVRERGGYHRITEREELYLAGEFEIGKLESVQGEEMG